MFFYIETCIPSIFPVLSTLMVRVSRMTERHPALEQLIQSVQNKLGQE